MENKIMEREIMRFHQRRADREEGRRRDKLIERHVRAALHADLPFSAQRISIAVARGCVTLAGELEWRYQRERADQAARAVYGASRVLNLITLRATVPSREIRARLDVACRDAVSSARR